MKSPLRAMWVALPLFVLPAIRPDLYKIPLEGTGPGSRLTGTAYMSPARSPFGIAMTPDGFFIFDIAVDIPVLPPVTSFGPDFKTYVVWLATADLDQIKRVGPLTPGTRLKGTVAMNKFLVVITAESTPNAEKWAGPIVMRGRSPSGYLTNFSGHQTFNGGVPQ